MENDARREAILSTITTKLESMARCIQRIQSQGDVSPQELRRNYDKQDVVVLNIERAVQLCIDIGGIVLSAMGQKTPNTMGETFTLLQAAGVIDDEMAASMRAAVGFRNVAVHQYDTLDMDIVSVIATKKLDDIRGFAKTIVDALHDRCI